MALENGLRALLVHDPEIAEGMLDTVAQCDSMSSMGERQGGSCDSDSESGASGPRRRKRGKWSSCCAGPRGADDLSSSDDESEESSCAEELQPELDDDDDDGTEGSSEDRQTKTAAAALCVGVGSFSDPPHRQGLAHFLEHMLFMGSEKFPDENEVEEFLSSHGGYSNAFTEVEHTCFHFEVEPAPGEYQIAAYELAYTQP